MVWVHINLRYRVEKSRTGMLQKPPPPLRMPNPSYWSTFVLVLPVLLYVSSAATTDALMVNTVTPLRKSRRYCCHLAVRIGNTDTKTKCDDIMEHDRESSRNDHIVVASSGHRRSFLMRSVQVMIMTASNTVIDVDSANAQQQSSTTITKPYASLQALLPATRAKLLIDRSVLVASKLQMLLQQENNNNSSTTTDPNDIALLFSELQYLLLTPHNLTQLNSTMHSVLLPIPNQPAQQYLESYKRSIQQSSFLLKPGAMLVQRGQVDTWKRLRRQEQHEELDNELRAALNLYTNQISFDGTAYLLTAPKEQRSKLLRNDALPDITTVITSDMGLRYLYRNDVLTAMDEAKYELQYQMEQQKNQQQPMDVTELQRLLMEAQKALTIWFSFIDETNVRDARTIVEQEGFLL